MKKVTPYKTARNAMAALDNGGRFYNFLTDAKDEVISTPELAKAAGLFSGKQNMVIFLEMALLELDESAKSEVISKLSDDLVKSRKKYLPNIYLPSEAIKNGRPAQSAIVTGVPKLIDSKEEFTGFIFIPIVAGNVTTMMLIPIIEQYDVYHLFDVNTSQDFLIAHVKGKNKLKEELTRCGGVLKELNQKKSDSSPKKLFLETLYYSKVF